MGLNLKDLGEGAGSSESRNTVIQKSKPLSLLSKRMEDSVLNDLHSFSLPAESKEPVRKQAEKCIRKIVHTSMFVTLNIMVSRKAYGWIIPKPGEKFDSDTMELVGQQQGAVSREVSFVVQRGLLQLGRDFRTENIVYKAKVVLKSKAAFSLLNIKEILSIN
jgi:hypothetical protein